MPFLGRAAPSSGVLVQIHKECFFLTCQGSRPFDVWRAGGISRTGDPASWALDRFGQGTVAEREGEKSGQTAVVKQRIRRLTAGDAEAWHMGSRRKLPPY